MGAVTPNKGFDPPSPLYLAVQGKFIDHKVVKLLLDGGADPNYQTSDGKTPLMEAASRGDNLAIKMLIDHGADIDSQDKYGWTAFWYAGANGISSSCKLLLSIGANPDILNTSGQPLQNYINYTQTRNWRKIKQLIKTEVSSRINEYAAQLKRTKLVSHAFEIAGEGSLFGKKIDFEGGHSEIACSVMAKSCKKFALDTDFKELSTLLENAILKGRAAINHATNPAVILTGFQGHSVSLLIYNNLFVICDRGANRISVQQFNPAKLDAETISKIRNVRYSPENEYKTLIYKTLPEQLEFKQADIRFNIPPQIVGNCSWAAPEGIIKAYLTLKNGPEVAEAKFLRWQLSQQMDLFEKYLKDPIDRGIIYQSFNVLWIAQKRSNEAVDAKRLEKLESLYTAGKTTSEVRIFRINKTLARLLPFRIPLDILQSIIGALCLFFTTGAIKLAEHPKAHLPLHEKQYAVKALQELVANQTTAKELIKIVKTGKLKRILNTIAAKSRPAQFMKILRAAFPNQELYHLILHNLHFRQITAKDPHTITLPDGTQATFEYHYNTKLQDLKKSISEKLGMPIDLLRGDILNDLYIPVEDNPEFWEVDKLAISVPKLGLVIKIPTDPKIQQKHNQSLTSANLNEVD